MRLGWVVLVALVVLTGCSSVKEQTGQYVTEAIAADVADRIDKKLESRGLSLDRIREAVDVNQDGSLSMEEIKDTAKLVATDLVSHVELDRRAQWEQVSKSLVTRDEQASIWAWIKSTVALLLTTIFGYLVKQVFSAKADSRRDVRLDVLEKLLHRDLDGDGQIGSAPQA